MKVVINLINNIFYFCLIFFKTICKARHKTLKRTILAPVGVSKIYEVIRPEMKQITAIKAA